MKGGFVAVTRGYQQVTGSKAPTVAYLNDSLTLDLLRMWHVWRIIKRYVV